MKSGHFPLGFCVNCCQPQPETGVASPALGTCTACRPRQLPSGAMLMDVPCSEWTQRQDREAGQGGRTWKQVAHHHPRPAGKPAAEKAGTSHSLSQGGDAVIPCPKAGEVLPEHFPTQRSGSLETRQTCKGVG